MKRQLLFFFTIICSLPVFASHIIGGEMIYEFLSADPVLHTKKYRITLRLFRDEHCGNCATMPPNVFIGIFDDSTRAQYPGYNRYFDVIKKAETDVGIERPACIQNAPDLDYHMATYEVEVNLPDNGKGYTASYQTCCRVAPIQNAQNDTDRGRGTGSTYACFIPGTAAVGPAGVNSSPQFANTISTLCEGKKFSLKFSATDPDNDLLKYRLSYAYNGGRTVDPRNVNPDPPTYGSVAYINGYSALQPLGPNATLDSNTGIISGIAPARGDYVVCVEISEYRAGKKIGIHRKDFIVNVSDCDVAGAALKPGYASCDGFSYTFENLNNSPLNKTFLWEFGDGITSNDPVPTHQFSDTGTYKIKLSINENDPECGESDSSEIKVYPGFFPAFTYSECENNPSKFKDLTEARYGQVVSWLWYFGEEGSIGDTSHVRNPIYTYPTPGHKMVTLIASSNKGCVDTVTREVVILGKAFAGRDTTVVAGQPLQFQASEGAIFTWEPAIDLSSPTIQNPVGLYSGAYDSIRYKVFIFNQPDCLDSAFITVHIFKTKPQIFVPSAFTPNGDGKNDVFLPVAAGIGNIEYIRVFNRWGQLVFSANSDRIGWDGNIKGKPQGSGTFVWLVKGMDYLGNPFFAKGTVLLIR